MNLDCLVVAAHPDDAELCVGGIVLSLKAKGASVGVLDLTNGEPTPHGDPQTRRKETDAASAILELDWRGNLGLPNRSLTATLEARAMLAEKFRELRPRVLLTHYWEDAHPDHVAASQLVEAARFWSKLTKTTLAGEPHYPGRILYFPSMHLRLHVQPSVIVDVSAVHERKMRAVACYRSQFIVGRPTEPPTFLDDVQSRDRYWGWLIGVQYGEPLISREPVGLVDLRALCGFAGWGG